MTEAKTATAAEANAAIAEGTAPADLEADAKAYCPGCGKRYDEVGATCTGASAEAPHAPIVTVATKEIGGDKETAAPDTD